MTQTPKRPDISPNVLHGVTLAGVLIHALFNSRQASIWRSAGLLMVIALGGCTPSATAIKNGGDTGLRLNVSAPIRIPAGRAHAIFQHGRLVSASNKQAPYCELEVRTVSPAGGNRVESGSFQVSRIGSRVLIDPTTRIPALTLVSSCSDPLFQESIWWLKSSRPSVVMYLRCIAPYYNCAFGPPLSPQQVQQQVGRYLEVFWAGEQMNSPVLQAQ